MAQTDTDAFLSPGSRRGAGAQPLPGSMRGVPSCLHHIQSGADKGASPLDAQRRLRGALRQFGSGFLKCDTNPKGVTKG